MDIVDRVALEKIVGDDFRALQKLLSGFLQGEAPVCASLEDAIRTRDFRKVSEDAHSLRGMVAVLAGYRARAACAELEKSAQVKDSTERIEQLFIEVKMEIQLLVEMITQILKDSGIVFDVT